MGWVGNLSRAHVLDELTRGGRGRELDLWHDADTRMIGTCNGLLCCFRRNREDLAVTNPVTGETIAVDLPPTWWYCRAQPTSYSFGYHPATGQYKIVHVPCVESDEIGAVLVFTLGGGGCSWGWRDAPAPAGSSCHLRFGIVTIDGVSYWVTRDAERIMSLDLGDERVAVVKSPSMPVPLPMVIYPCHLTNVRGRVGFAMCRPDNEFGRSKTEVWVLEGGQEEERAWAKCYTLLAHGVYSRQEIALPHVAHGEHVLTTCEPWGGKGGLRLTLNAHCPRNERKMRPCAMVRVGAPRPETVVGMYDCYSLETRGARARVR
uniref:F-box associated beta-propeller type 3 domain-containing protein n=1 Tax=Setaria viridis TaxID=4556 RepID=A0A4U6VHL1_SETVI|nr:hypothetical protein SEVIR_3G263100v2 [Setaria viridis]